MTGTDDLVPLDVALSITIEHNLSVLGAHFAETGLTGVEMTFDGHDGEGHIQEIAYRTGGPDPENVPAGTSGTVIEGLQEADEARDDGFTPMGRCVDAGPMTLRDALDECGLAMLERFDRDWQKGPGAGGRIRIDAAGEAALEIGVRRVTEYEMQYRASPKPLTAEAGEAQPGL